MVENLEQALGVVWFIPRDQRDAGGLGLRDFFRRSAERLAGVDGLRDGGGEMLRLERGERSGEHGFGRAERFQELSGHARAEARCEREGHPGEISIVVVQVAASVRSCRISCQVSTSTDDVLV